MLEQDMVCHSLSVLRSTLTSDLLGHNNVDSQVADRRAQTSLQTRVVNYRKIRSTCSTTTPAESLNVPMCIVHSEAYHCKEAPDSI